MQTQIGQQEKINKRIHYDHTMLCIIMLQCMVYTHIKIKRMGKRVNKPALSFKFIRRYLLLATWKIV